MRAVSIPGIDFGDGGPNATGSGNFRVVEPRPVFVKSGQSDAVGRLVYLTSIIPKEANSVSKTVVVDAETNKLVAIFDNDRDPQAEAKTLHLHQDRRGARRRGGAGREQRRRGGHGSGLRRGCDRRHDDDAGLDRRRHDDHAGRWRRRSVERQLDDVIRRQRELLREIERLRDEVAPGRLIRLRHLARASCITVPRVSRTIRVRNVSEEAHRTLNARAAAAGMSLSDYVKRDLEAAAAQPLLEEIDARVRARGTSRLRSGTVLEALRHVRGS